MNYHKDSVFLALQEIPSEITLVIPLAGCSHSCRGCHSPHLQDKDGGEWLTFADYSKLLEKYENKASCICFFGGEHNADDLMKLAHIARIKGFKSALYSGFDFEELPEGLADCFDYVKCGSFVEELGGLDKEGTNQRMLKKVNGEWINITSEFQRSDYV